MPEWKTGQLGTGLLLAITVVTASGLAHAETDADRLLGKVRNQVVALRVFGEAADAAHFPPKQPPIWGTGFVIGPPAANINEKRRIITAGHVVQKDDMWKRRGSGPSRTVFPTVLGAAGRIQVEGFRGVVLNDNSDIAQVYGPRNIEPVTVAAAALSASERYFVVSWGVDDAWGEPTEEPYVKEIKVVNPAANDPPVEPGLALVEIVPGQQSAFFKQSESGSPVFNMAGEAVGIMIRERIDAGSNLAVRGIALPFETVSQWLDVIRQQPVNEPGPIVLREELQLHASRNPQAVIPAFKSVVDEGCVFLGKYSARNRDQNTMADAPMGTPFLKRMIELFPEAAPDQVSDQNAVTTRQLPESQTVLIPANGAVNVRAYCPNVVPKARRTNQWERVAYYGPVIARADGGFAVRVKRVQRQAYLQDFFYWGEIDGVFDRMPGMPADQAPMVRDPDVRRE
jgi:hypothetical protein